MGHSSIWFSYSLHTKEEVVLEEEEEEEGEGEGEEVEKEEEVEHYLP